MIDLPFARGKLHNIYPVAIVIGMCALLSGGEHILCARCHG